MTVAAADSRTSYRLAFVTVVLSVVCVRVPCFIVLLSFSAYLGDLLFIGMAIGPASVGRLSKNSEFVYPEMRETLC